MHEGVIKQSTTREMKRASRKEGNERTTNCTESNAEDAPPLSKKERVRVLSDVLRRRCEKTETTSPEEGRPGGPDSE